MTRRYETRITRDTTPEDIELAKRWNKELSENEYLNYGITATDLPRKINEIVQNEVITERLESLSSRIRAYAINVALSGVSVKRMALHLDILEVSGWPKFIKIDSHFCYVNDFQKSLKAASEGNHVYEEVSTDFKDAVKSIRCFDVDAEEIYVDNFERSEILILRSVYGENAVTDFLMRANKEFEKGIPMYPAEMIPILKDWDNLKNFPLTWSRDLTLGVSEA